MENINWEDEVLGSKEINLLDYWNIVWKRKWLITLVAVLALAVAAYKTFSTVPLYTARGTLLIERDRPNFLAFDQVFVDSYYQYDYYETQYKLLESRSLAAAVVDRLKLAEAATPSDGTEEGSPAVPDQTLRRALITAFQGKMRVNPIKDTRLVQISVRDPDPEFAADGVNAVFDAFIEMNINRKFSATEDATEFLTEQIADLRTEIQKKETALQAYSVEKNIVTLSDSETTVIEQLGDLNKALTEARIERLQKEAYYNEIKNASFAYLPESLVNNPMIQKLREEYNTLNRQYIKMEEKYKPEYPEMQRLKRELDSVTASLDEEVKNLSKGAYTDFQAALTKERSLQSVFDDQKNTAIQMNSNAISYNQLKIELDNSKELLETLLRRQSETGVSARLSGMRTSNIRVVDRAEVPLYPSSPNRQRDMLMGLIFGLFGGIGLAFGLHYLDNTVKTAQDVERYTALPTLGIVPKYSENGMGNLYGYGHGDNIKSVKMGKRKTAKLNLDTGGSDHRKQTIELITHFEPTSIYSENYRTIRTSFLLSNPDSEIKSVLFTSSLPSEGKTATVSNLAIALAQANKRVIIIDGDLRKPRQHKIFKMSNKNGLSNYLTSDMDLKDLIKVTDVPGLFLINSGPVPPNPTELLASKKMAALLEKLKDYYDFVFVDSPPLLAVSDAMVLSPLIDGMVLVVWGGKTTREATKRSKEKIDLMRVKALGVIINRIDLKANEYYYKNYHYHYYGDTAEKA